MICVCLIYDGNSRRLNRKWFYREAGNQTCDPWFIRHSAYPLHHGGFSKFFFVAFPWVETSTGPGGFMICVCLIYDGNSRRLNRKWFYREAGNQTCDPWFMRHSTYPLHHGGFSKFFFCGFSMGRNQYWAGRVYDLCVFNI